MKTTVHNSMTIGAQQPPKSVNEVYTIAANWIRMQAVHRHGQATKFVMMGLDNKPSGNKHGKASSGKEQGNQYSTYAERVPNTRCHKCKVLGHYANKCPLLMTKQEGVVSVVRGDDGFVSCKCHMEATRSLYYIDSKGGISERGSRPKS